jgi:hypothetical protein
MPMTQSHEKRYIATSHEVHINKTITCPGSWDAAQAGYRGALQREITRLSERNRERN